MTTQLPRIQPLEPPYEPELADMLAKWMPPGAAVEPLKLFRTLAHNPELMSRMRPLGAGLLGSKSLLEVRHRELVIDRVCARCGCQYEWGVHVTAYGGSVGLSNEQLLATVTASPDDAVWSAQESLLLRFTDELCDHSSVSDTTWTQMAAHWNAAQLLELTVLVGWYHLISFVANAARVTPESWAALFPA